MAAGIERLRQAIDANPPQPTQQTPGQEYRSTRLLERGRTQLPVSFTFPIVASGLTTITSGTLLIGPVKAHQRYRVRVLSGVVVVPGANQNTVSLQSVGLIDPRTFIGTQTVIPARISGFTALAQEQGFAVDDFNLDSDDEAILAPLTPNFQTQLQLIVNNSAATTPTLTVNALLEIERFLYDGVFQPTP